MAEKWMAAGIICSWMSMHTALAAELPEPLHFSITDHDKTVGHLTIRFSQDGDQLIVRREEAISLQRFMIKATMTQTVEEHWRGDRFMSLQSDTISKTSLGDSQKHLRVARSGDGTIVASSDDETHELPADALPMSFWSKRTLQSGAHFNITNGKPAAMVSGTGADLGALRSYQSHPCVAVAFDVEDDSKHSQLVAWTDQAGTLCGLRLQAGHETFAYVRQGARRHALNPDPAAQTTPH